MTNQSENHPSKDQLVAFGLGKLDGSDAELIAKHLDSCHDCSATIVSLTDDTFVSLVRSSPAPATESDTPPQAEDSQVPHDATIDVASGVTDATSRVIELPPELREHPRYEILKLIGHGGMGDVYKAQHKVMNRTVALKVIKPELVRNDAAVERFRREVQAAAQLHHKNIVTAYDAEQAGNLHYLVMEFVDGVDLDEVIRKRGSLPVEEACAYIRQAAEGLEHAHELGMVHRDIKPHNLMVEKSLVSKDESQEPETEGDSSGSSLSTLDSRVSVKILDFGLANFVAEEAVEEAIETESPGGVSAPQLTLAGSMMGTPDYMAPEQADDAHSADIRADIYSLGCTLYCLLTGIAPFAEGSVMDKVKAHTEEAAPPLSEFRDDVPEEVEAVLLKMMAKDPAERYQTPAEVASALEEFIESIVDRKLRERAGGGGGLRQRRELADGDSNRRWLVVAIALLVSLGVGSFIFRHQIASLWQDQKKWSASEANAAPSNEVVFSFSENEDGPGTIGRFQGEVVNDPDAVMERLKKLAAENPDLVVRIEGDVDFEGPDFLEKFENALRAAGVRFIKLPPEIEERRRAAAESTFALEKARSERTNNLVRIGMALHDYLSAAGEFPPFASVVPTPPPPRETSNGSGKRPSRNGGKRPAPPENVKAPEKTKPRTDAGNPERSTDAFFDEDGRPHLSWRVHLLPFFRQKELTELYDKFHLDEAWDSEHNKALLAAMPPQFKTTDDPTKTTLLAIVGEGAAYEGKAGANRESFKDGFLNTAYVVDAGRERAVPWTKPEDLPFDPQDPIRAFGTSDFGDVFLALLADGAVGSIPYDTASESLRALFTRAAGDTFDKNAKRTTPLPQSVSSPESQGEVNKTQPRSPPDKTIAALLAEARLILTFDEGHFLEQDSTNLVRDMSWYRTNTIASGAVYTPEGVSGGAARMKKDADGLIIEDGLIASGNPYTVAGWIWLNWTRDDENPKAEVFSNRPRDDRRGFTASVARVGEYFKIGQDVPAQGDQPGQESISGSWGPFGFDDERPNLNFAQGRWGFVAFRRGTDGRLGYTVDGKSGWTPAKPMGHRSVPDKAFIGRGLDGRVDEFVVFDRALSDEEVELLYRHGRAGRGLAETDQVDLSSPKKPTEKPKEQPKSNHRPTNKPEANDQASSAEAMIERAASIPLDEWKKLATSENPLPSLITGSPLSLVLTLLNPPEAAKENSKVLDDFRYLKPGIPKATEIAQAMSHSSERGYVSMLQRAYILKVNTMSRQPKTADETGVSVFQGTIDFEAPQLYAGRVHFTAEVESQTARVTEFRLPNYDITIRRDKNGAWQRVQPAN